MYKPPTKKRTFPPGSVALLGLALLVAGPLQAQDSWRTVTSARQLQAEKRLDVRVEYAAGTMEISPSRAGRLYDFDLRYNEEHFTPLSEYARGTGRLHLGVRSRECHALSMRRGDTGQGRAAVHLTRDIPLALDLRFGAGEARLELGGLRLESLELATGASETTVSFAAPNPISAEYVQLKAGAAALRATGIGNTGAARFDFEGGVGSAVLDFTGSWSRSASGAVKIGLGSVKLIFPRDLGVRLNRSSFLSSFQAAGLVQRDGDYYSPNWDQARHQLTLDVRAALGSIDVEWVD